MLNYKVFDKNNKNTYPIENSMVMAWEEHSNIPYICNFTNGVFIRVDGVFLDSCKIIYAYIGRKPKIASEKSVKKCGIDLAHCEYYDDGYCWNCPHFCRWTYTEKEYIVE